VNEVSKIIENGLDAPIFLVLSLGLGMVATGFISVMMGRTWINEHSRSWRVETVLRTDKPKSFWCIVIFLYWGLGLLFIVSSGVLFMQNVGYLSRPLFK
jgi:hypothetical protein